MYRARPPNKNAVSVARGPSQTGGAESKCKTIRSALRACVRAREVRERERERVVRLRLRRRRCPFAARGGLIARQSDRHQE